MSELHTSSHSWATRQLGLPAEADPAARAEFMKRLGESSFLPPARWQAAYRMLTQGMAASPVLDVGAEEEEGRLRAKLEAFEASYFDLPPAERRRQWQELAGECAERAPLAARVKHLKTGLDVIAGPTGGSEHMDRLADEVRDLYLLRQPAKAARRRRFLAEIGVQLADWEVGAGLLKRNHPAIAALDPVLVRYLTDPQPVVQSRRRYVPSSSSSHSWAQYLWVAVVVGLVRVFAGGGGSGSGNRYREPVPNYDLQRRIQEMRDEESRRKEKFDKRQEAYDKRLEEIRKWDQRRLEEERSPKKDQATSDLERRLEEMRKPKPAEPPKVPSPFAPPDRHE